MSSKIPNATSGEDPAANPTTPLNSPSTQEKGVPSASSVSVPSRPLTRLQSKHFHQNQIAVAADQNKKRTMSVDEEGVNDDDESCLKSKKTKKEEPVDTEDGAVSVVAIGEAVTAKHKEGRKKRERLEQPEKDIDPKSECGFGRFCKLSPELKLVEWVKCDRCHQWWHNACKFGHNNMFQEDSYSCCAIAGKSGGRKRRA